MGMKKKKMNVVLITLDALRKDRVGAYGCKKKLTPTIDYFSSQGVVFDNAITANTSSMPSHTSIFTSNYSVVHGVRENGWKLQKDLPTLAQVFSSNDFETMAAVSVENMSSFFGLNKGFGKYYNNNKADVWYHRLSNVKIGIGKFRFFSILTFLRKIKILKNTHTRCSTNTNKDVFSWLEKNYMKDFFCWIHYFDIHTPYSPDYDSSVKIADSAVRNLKNKLGELGILDKTLIVFFADHGESLGEHGYNETHGYSVYDEEINVPLIIWNPKILKSKRISEQIRTIDISPTILDIVGLDVPREFKGKSLLPYLGGVAFEGFDAFTEAYPPYRKCYSIRTKDSWKYIFNGDKEAELYNIKKDSKELINVLKNNKEKARVLSKKLSDWFDKGVDTEEQDPNEFVKQNLEALGYL